MNKWVRWKRTSSLSSNFSNVYLFLFEITYMIPSMRKVISNKSSLVIGTTGEEIYIERE